MKYANQMLKPMRMIDRNFSDKFATILSYFRVTRRNYIEAKYVQKSFLRPLPPSNQMRSSTRTIRRWSIVKSSLSSLNLGNENEDDLSHSLKPINRRLDFLHRGTTSSDNDSTTGTNTNYF
jgi:hypothetical protein